MSSALIAIAVVLLVVTGHSVAEERQFLVMLANSPKECNLPCLVDNDCDDNPCLNFNCVGFVCQGGLINPQLIDDAYFDAVDGNGVDSFLEYWEEVSYGDVRISPSFQRSKTTDWGNLPWNLIRPAAADLVCSQGSQESFNNFLAMVTIDLDGDPNGIENGPFSAGDNPPYARGGGDFTDDLPPKRVWMPGERFIDMDGDNRWDALDEAANQIDFFNNLTGELIPDDLPDLAGPWIDLNADGDPENEQDCVYLVDGDNDGNPDCCPDGPGDGGKCDPFDPTSATDNACVGTTWQGPNGNTIIDCNGNLIDDAVDIANGTSLDRLPVSDSPTGCDQETNDGIPDECQIRDFRPGEQGTCVEEVDDDQDSSCLNVPVCNLLDPVDQRAPLERCEYVDSNGNDELDIVEPFENFLRRWDSATGGWIIVSDTYIENNYPGTASAVIAQHDVRVLRGAHDNLTTGACTCMDGSDCDEDRTCPAGEHAEFNPPDFWSDQGTTKMYNEDPDDRFGGAEFVGQLTGQPEWFVQAWVDRYGTEQPSWSSFGGSPAAAACPEMIPFGSVDPPLRRCFDANRGGVNSNGTGWVGCGTIDPIVNFETSNDCAPGLPAGNAFDQACNEARILPEEFNGVGTQLLLYDGPREFDDLPSSKYHIGGDHRLGEVTSPFSGNIWGQDRGNHNPQDSLPPDGRIAAAGPYATSIHGNFGRDAGNLLLMEMLTSRTNGLSKTGFADTNLDGTVDQGSVPLAGIDNYGGGPCINTDDLVPPDAVTGGYPWNRRRLVEDCMEIFDDVLDFDDFVDPVTLDQIDCVRSPHGTVVPPALQGGSFPNETLRPAGALSGIVLLPPGTILFPNIAPGFFPIHNEDGLDLVALPDTNLPRIQSEEPPFVTTPFVPRINWNIFVHDLVMTANSPNRGGTPSEDFQAAFAANAYLNSWEGFPVLFDLDVNDPPGPIVNCPVGLWDIVADAGMVHSVPVLKESTCTEWIEPVDLVSVVTPGVDTTITLPPAEFVRDESYFFLENENRLGERYYFWSAGHPDSFDKNLPGEGMLVLHTDVGPDKIIGSNVDALSQQQRSGTRPAFLIVQADGLNDLQACSTGGNDGDDGDTWPGSTDATRFNFNTVPSATWYTQSSWIGLDILNVVPDGSGSVQITVNWVPTTIPSLRFIDPPGGQSVGDSFQVRFDATDVFGGTTIRVFVTEDVKTCEGSGNACVSAIDDCPAGERCVHDLAMSSDNLIGEIEKVNPGTRELSIDWDISLVADDRYVLFAKLNPSIGADGTEDKSTEPRPGRNNLGTGTMDLTNVDIDDDTSDTDDSSRLESWTAECIDPNGVEWLVTSSLTLPDFLANPVPSGCADPLIACTGQSYTSPGGEVSFTINPGGVAFVPGDTFAFTTTGITAVSQPFSVVQGEISAGPIAGICASVFSGLPPLTVTFDAEGLEGAQDENCGNSVDPNGEPLDFQWNFQDGTAEAFGSRVTHTFEDAGTFSVRLTATNGQTGLFDEATVDIIVVNNSPTAVISANPASGPAPLTVVFDGTQSSDLETEDPADLTYQWDFGDGTGANANGGVGLQHAKPTHTYTALEDGTLCTNENPCSFTAALTVSDELGKTDVAVQTVLVGNSDPIPIVSATPLTGPAPMVVEFNAIDSIDPEGDDMTVDWDWGDGQVTNSLPITGNVDGTGLVRHTYAFPSPDGIPFHPTATIKDGRGGEATWPGVDIFVSTNLGPTAACTVSPAVGIAGVTSFVFNASGSSDPEGQLSEFDWDFGDGTPNGTQALQTHTFELPGEYAVVLTVTDSRLEPDSSTCTATVSPNLGNQAPLALIATGLRICAATCTLSFDGSLSIDPDGTELTHLWSFVLDDVFCASDPACPTGFTCVAGTCSTARQEPLTNVQFTTPGNYSVVLTVTDVDGGVDDAGPQEIRILEPGSVIAPDPGSGRPTGGITDEPQDSALQRPSGLCGFGVLTGFFGSLIGLTGMLITRRRLRFGIS